LAAGNPDANASHVPVFPTALPLPAPAGSHPDSVTPRLQKADATPGSQKADQTPELQKDNTAPAATLPTSNWSSRLNGVFKSRLALIFIALCILGLSIFLVSKALTFTYPAPGPDPVVQGTLSRVQLRDLILKGYEPTQDLPALCLRLSESFNDRTLEYDLLPGSGPQGKVDKFIERIASRHDGLGRLEQFLHMDRPYLFENK
jgi:hypothetical protein